MLRIIGYKASINVRKVLWAAAEMDIPFEWEERGGAHGPSTREPAFLALNPFGLTPVIVDGAVVLRESNTIVRYLAATRGRTDLLPATPAERARVELWMDWQLNDFNPTWLAVFRTRVRASTDYTEAEVLKSERAFTAAVQMLDQELATRAFIAGDAFTLADICVGLGVHRWRVTPMAARPPVPNIDAYFARLEQRAGLAAGIEGGAA
jgi:glutathione S-transferase